MIAGGLAGLTTALQLARGGQKVVVLESQSVASAHPAATAVFVSAGYATGVEQIARIIGTEAADKLNLMSIEGVDFVRDTITVSTLRCQSGVDGVTSVMRYDDGPECKAMQAEARHKYGQRLEISTRRRSDRT